MAAPLEIRAHRGDDCGAEGEEVAPGDVRGGMGAIGLILFGAVMPETNLVLVVQPFLVVFSAGRVEYPLSKALADALAILLVGLAGAASLAVPLELPWHRDYSTPHLYQIFGLIFQHVVGEAQVDHVFVGEEGGRH